MVKAYLKFIQDRVFGLISTSNSLFDEKNQNVITGCGERISIWNLRKGTLVKSLYEEETTSEVTTLALSKDGRLLAAGHNDGSIRIWGTDDQGYELISVFNGHRGAVTCLSFNRMGSILASGSRDNEIIVWDVITESGLYRLRGHRDQITCVKLLEKSGHLISSSKDGLIKVWDTETQHCIQTIVGHRNPVWSIDVNPDETRLVSCTSDSQIRVWRLFKNELKSESSSSELHNYIVNTPINTSLVGLGGSSSDAVENPSNEEKERLEQQMQNEKDLEILNDEEFAKYYGSIPVKAESVSGVRFDPTNQYLAVQSTGKFLDFFRITSYEKIQIKDIKVVDEFRHKQTIKTSSKIRFFSFGNEQNWNKFVVTLAGNSIETFELQDEGYDNTFTLDQAGHRSDIRSLTLSSNDSMLVSTSSECVKVWNVKTLNCILTFPCDYGLCAIFAPGNLHVIVGTKKGSIEIFELSSREMVASIQAHKGSVWTLALTPDQRGIVSGGSDKIVQFWDFDLVNNEENSKQKNLSLSLSQTLKLESDVLALKFSKNNKFLAISLLDNTVKIFFSDTLKFHLSLYGHKLPVMCLDISDDSTLIITGSADKNIKIWGLDYGDCHKSIFAHDDSVMQMNFIPKTHHFVTTGKDKRIKYWDADKFEHIQTIEYHHGEVWALAMGSVGDFFITGSHDRSMRLFKQTEEPIFVDSERQHNLEKEWEATLEDDNRVRTREMLEENAAAGKTTLETIMAGEEILDAINLVIKEKQRLEEHEMDQRNSKIEIPFQPDIMLLGRTDSEYLWLKMNKIRPSDLEEALRVLPFGVIKTLFEYFNEWLALTGKSIEFIFKCAFFLIQIHQNQLSVSVDHIETLQTLNTNIKNRLAVERNKLGFNRSAMGYVKREIEINQQYKFFNNESLQEQKDKEKLESQPPKSAQKVEKNNNSSGKKRNRK
eukprot:gene632-783_t